MKGSIKITRWDRNREERHALKYDQRTKIVQNPEIKENRIFCKGDSDQSRLHNALAVTSDFSEIREDK